MVSRDFTVISRALFLVPALPGGAGGGGGDATFVLVRTTISSFALGVPTSLFLGPLLFPPALKIVTGFAIVSSVFTAAPSADLEKNENRVCWPFFGG